MAVSRNKVGAGSEFRVYAVQHRLKPELQTRETGGRGRRFSAAHHNPFYFLLNFPVFTASENNPHKVLNTMHNPRTLPGQAHASQAWSGRTWLTAGFESECLADHPVPKTH
jgi:hypothetical protein